LSLGIEKEERVGGVRHVLASCAVVVYQHLQRNKRKIASDILEGGLRLLRTLAVGNVQRGSWERFGLSRREFREI
jgi:hypothetical protein